MQLSKLEKVDLREAWKHEATDFTNWLAQPENLELLSDEIGIDIALIQTEARVGNFNVDILAEEENTERKIVIENQLELTDHDHLGKIITYASGFDAEIVVWISKSIRDEHKQAIDWLNEHTDSKSLFTSLYEHKEKIESELNEKLEWKKLPERKASRIKLIFTGSLFNQENWEQYHLWMLDSVTKFQAVFGKYIKQCAN